MTNKSWVLALAFAMSLSLAGSAFAQRSNFEGFYAGVQAGYSDVSADLTGSVVVSDDGDGFGGGGFVGFGGTNGNLYGSVEVEIGYDGAEWSQTRAGGTDEIEARLTYGVGFRVGAVVADDFLIYGRIGWIRTNAEYSFTGIGSGDQDFDGGRIGGGVEGKFGSVGVRAEYTYTDYEDITVLGVKVAPEQHLFRIGVAYYF